MKRKSNLQPLWFSCSNCMPLFVVCILPQRIASRANERRKYQFIKHSHLLWGTQIMGSSNDIWFDLRDSRANANVPGGDQWRFLWSRTNNSDSNIGTYNSRSISLLITERVEPRDKTTLCTLLSRITCRSNLHSNPFRCASARTRLKCI